MITDFLYKNIRWQFNQNPFANLLAIATSEQQFYEQVEKISNSYFPEQRSIDTVELEFCLNKIALSHAKKPSQVVALNYFQQFWAQYVRLKKLFRKNNITFPSSARTTRVERICELIAKCTQFAVEDDTLHRLLSRAAEITELSEREERYLWDVAELYKLKFYCAATIALLQNKPYAEKALAKMLKPTLLKQDFAINSVYTHAPYVTDKIAAVVDCMGESTVRLNDIFTQIDCKLFVYANGRNVFDTFCESKFGERVAEVASHTKSIDVFMQYHLDSSKEIRHVVLTNKSKVSRKFSVVIPFRHLNPSNKVEYFKMGDALCIATEGESFYCGIAIVHDNATVSCYGEQSLCFDVKIEKGTSFSFDIVTAYSINSPSLADALAELEQFGNTNCPYLWDNACTRVSVTGTKLNLTPHGYVLKQPAKILSQQLHFTYQLGDNDVATFVDNGGNCTTLLDGFVFGIKGEGIYSVRQGLIKKINENNFHLDVDRLIYKKDNTECIIYHDSGKIYNVTHKVPSKTLIYFPFEKLSHVRFDSQENVFTVEDDLRKYYVKCVGEIESYTTNAMECNEEKLRYKLSGDSAAGSCLAICFATSDKISLRITSAKKAPLSCPIIRESLISTYLNYINDKNVFCLTNHLKRADCLTLTAICYTNPQFVKQYLLDYASKTQHPYYYDLAGRTKKYDDKLAFPLAVVYYLNLVGDLPDDIVKQAHDTLFNEEYGGNNLCLKALALIRGAHLKGFDKVRCLVEYSNIKKKISTDSKLYAYAQAIGALPLTNPSKERLKDLCNKYGIPKSWYYVSQLENLYGLNICAGKLHITPKVTAENVLEQFALTIEGKRIDTSFAKATVQSMTLNGIQCYQPFYPSNLKNVNNQLVVRY